MHAYADLVRDHHATVYRVALGVLRDPSLAEDVAQDVFLSFLDDPGSLDGAEHLRAFVCRTALNRALDVRKAGKRRAVRESAVNQGRGEMDPVEAAFRSELRSKVAELPEDQRQAVDLHYFQGLTLREAGLALAVPEGTVSSRISAALGRLRTALGAAAFVGLLAMLESELGKCAAEERVPEGLSKRLLRLRPRKAQQGSASPSGEAGTAKSRVRIAVTAAVALLAVLFFAKLAARELQGRAPRDESPQSTPVAANSASSASSTPSSSVPPVTTQTPPPATAPLEMEGFVVDSFEAGKPSVLSCRTPDPLTVRELLEGPGGTIMERSAAPPWFVTPGPLDAEPRGKRNRFSGWLTRDQSFAETPRVWVRVQYERTDPEQSRARLKCLKVLERDELSQAWLEAWRELAEVNFDLRGETDQPPGQEKRQRLLALESRLAKAIPAARDLRTKGALAGWCLTQERLWAAASSGIFRRMGLGRDLPAFPTEQQLTDIFLKTANPQSLRDEVVGRFGEDALRENAFYVTPEGDSFSPRWMSIANLAALPVAEFDALRTSIASVPPPQRKEAESHAAGHHVREPDLSPRAEAMGIHGAQLEEFDAARLSLECGVEVKSVDAGSAAEKAGIKAGDVLWKVVSKWVRPVSAPGTEEETTPEVGALIRNAAWMDYLLEEREKVDPKSATFAVVRNGEVVIATVELR